MYDVVMLSYGVCTWWLYYTHTAPGGLFIYFHSTEEFMVSSDVVLVSLQRRLLGLGASSEALQKGEGTMPCQALVAVQERATLRVNKPQNSCALALCVNRDRGWIPPSTTFLIQCHHPRRVSFSLAEYIIPRPHSAFLRFPPIPTVFDNVSLAHL